MILVGVHGDEKCGVEALGKMLPSLKIQKGQLLVGYGNPRAIQRNVRLTESNLNRMFKPDEMLSRKERTSYEYNRAQFLKQYLDRADALLDIHASCTPGSLCFAICEQNAGGIVRHMPLSTVVSGFDRIQPGGTDYYMNRQSKIGLCVECGYLGDSLSTEVAEKSIIAFLISRGHITGNQNIYPQSSIQVDDMYITQNNFKLSKPFKDFEGVLASQLIGIDGKNEIRAQRNGVILFAQDKDKAGEEAFLLGRYKETPQSFSLLP